MLLYVSIFNSKEIKLTERLKKQITQTILWFYTFNYKVQFKLVGDGNAIKYIHEIIKQYNILLKKNYTVIKIKAKKNIVESNNESDYNIFIFDCSQKNFNDKFYSFYKKLENNFNTIIL